MMRARFFSCVGSLLGPGVVVLVGLNAVASSQHTVTMEAMKYVPETLTVNEGDTVLWVNKDIVAHTATSAAAGFDSGSVAVNGSWKFEAKKKGTFTYACSFHPTMKGTLVVK